MSLTIELPDDLAAALNAQAQQHGLSAAGYAQRILKGSLTPHAGQSTPDQPFETGRGMLSKYGPAPSAEEIDASRADMFRGFRPRMNIAGVADTHAAIWHLFDDPRLSDRARQFIDNAAATRRKIALSSIRLAEIVYLIEKNRLPASVYDDIKKALSDPNHVLHEVPLTGEVVEAMRQVPRVAVPDMPDRIVAATAIHLGVPVISRDGRIQAADLDTVW